MSLSSFLLTADSKKDQGKVIDKGLDALFHSTAAAPSSSARSHTSTSTAPPTAILSSKPVIKDTVVKTDKKRKLTGQEPSPAKKSKREPRAVIAHEASPVPSPLKEVAPPVRSHKKKKAKDQDDSKKHEEQEEEVAIGKASGSKSDDSDEDEEVDPSKLVHESVAVDGKAKSSCGRVKYVPPEETPELRDARTVFVGNVPVEVVKNRPLQKQLERHILSFVPSAKIESTRFRSVAFQKPTTQLPSDDPSSSKSTDKPRDKEGRQHDRDRAASWRASKGDDEEESAYASGKIFLTPHEKKRIAFIKQEIHSGVDSVNAYVVFAHPVPTENWPKNLPMPKPAMDPFEAAKTVVRKADGSVFMERTIRVDSATKGKGKISDATDAELAGDPKTTVFVGSLDFASKEEDVRAFFEGLIVAERGQPRAEDNGNSSTWVKRVRVIRDKDTLLGKGFGYVQFIDRECVDEILALEEGSIKFARRKLRVQRCKTLPGAPKVNTQKPSGLARQNTRNEGPTRQRPSVTFAPVSIPKGDPSLGTKISGLSKEERKQVKASSADRVARRLAKKKAKSLADKGVRATDKERARKRPKDKKGVAPEKSKRRVRSNKALLKMNTKK